MTMWGEVAELMEDLATAHCYCEYTKFEDLESITWADKMLPTLNVLTKAQSVKKKLSSGGLFSGSFWANPTWVIRRRVVCLGSGFQNSGHIGTAKWN